MQHAYYSASITDFLAASENEILGALLKNSGGPATEHTQREAWLQQIKILKHVLANLEPTDHQLSQEYRHGITASGVKEIMTRRLKETG